MTQIAEDRSSKPLLVTAETLLSVLGVCLVFAFPLVLFAAYFCIGECRGPDPGALRTFHVLVGVLVVVVVATAAVAWRRGARLALAWHAFVALAGIGSAIVFQVPVVDWADYFREDPPAPNPYYVPCHSGSNDCPGG